MVERLGMHLLLSDLRLAVPDPENYRFAVFCCSFKMDLSDTPDHALALFADMAMAKRYGAWMWPSTFEVVDRFAQTEATD